LAILGGGLLPIISLTSLHFFVKYEEPEKPIVENDRDTEINLLMDLENVNEEKPKSKRGRKKKVGVILFDRSRFVFVCTSLIFSLSLSFFVASSARKALFLSSLPPHPTLPLFYAAVDVEVPAVPPPPAAWSSVAEDVEVLPPPPATPAPEAAAPPPPLSGNSGPRPGRPEVTAAVTAAPFPAAPPPVFVVVICCYSSLLSARRLSINPSLFFRSSFSFIFSSFKTLILSVISKFH
jgi:hypothetical protein